jgi:hypothetical protein
MSVKDYERLKNASKRQPLVQFMEGLGLDGLVIERDKDRGRDIDF